jgi:serine protease Do
MKRLFPVGAALAASAVLLALTASARADDGLSAVTDAVNAKTVKIFGSGGLKGIPAFGTGVLVSPDGYILTVNTPMLQSGDLRVHLSDGRKYSHCKIVAQEPELDAALIKIDFGQEGPDPDKPLPYFDIAAAAKKPILEVGDGVLAFTNAFEIAQRDDWVSVQHGTVSAFCKLHGRNGIFEAPYHGKVYIVDAITNNPGAAGGPLTTRKGELVGVIGRSLRNELTNTWMHYTVPLDASVEIKQADGKTTETRTIVELVEKKEKYQPIQDPTKVTGGGEDTYSGIILVANPVDITPPYVEEVEPGSPAAKAGFKPDDLIVYVEGISVKTINSYKEVMKGYHPNQVVHVVVRRGEKLPTLDLTLAPPKNPPKKPAPPAPEKDK